MDKQIDSIDYLLTLLDGGVAETQQESERIHVSIAHIPNTDGERRLLQLQQNLGN